MSLSGVGLYPCEVFAVILQERFTLKYLTSGNIHDRFLVFHCSIEFISVILWYPFVCIFGIYIFHLEHTINQHKLFARDAKDWYSLPYLSLQELCVPGEALSTRRTINGWRSRLGGQATATTINKEAPMCAQRGITRYLHVFGHLLVLFASQAVVFLFFMVGTKAREICPFVIPDYWDLDNLRLCNPHLIWPSVYLTVLESRSPIGCSSID